LPAEAQRKIPSLIRRKVWYLIDSCRGLGGKTGGLQKIAIHLPWTEDSRNYSLLKGFIRDIANIKFFPKEQSLAGTRRESGIFQNATLYIFEYIEVIRQQGCAERVNSALFKAF
jgi:hypothetical protein